MTSLPWKRAIVVGASSGIGEAVARKLGEGGCQVALVARRESELRSLAEFINTQAGSNSASWYINDVTDTPTVAPLFETIVRDLGGLDLIVYASGVMPKMERDEYNVEKDTQMVAVNVSGAVAWLRQAAHRFGKAKSGTIVGISSVAGDRGRCGNPVYGATKAALDTYLEGLRNRIARYGATVVTIKPGPVATPMTDGLGKMPMMISAEEAADAIIDAARNKVNVAYIPGKWRIVMAVIRAVPSAIFKYLNI